MRGWILLLAGVATAAGLVLVSRSKGGLQSGLKGTAGHTAVDELAGRLQGAWADHHTVA